MGISAEFKDQSVLDKKHNKSKGAAGPPGGEQVVKSRPFLVASWKRQSFRTQMRKEKDKVSITELLCLVLDKDEIKNYAQIKDLVEENKRWCKMIEEERVTSKQVQGKAAASDKGKNQAEDQDGEFGDLQDTIAFLERDIEAVNREIDVFEKNIQSCEQQQHYNRKQIETLTHQATRLTESQGKFSAKKLEGKQTGAQKKDLEKQLAEITDFIEANKNTRATLLDQRAETDKEKQRLTSDLASRREHRDNLIKRKEMVDHLGTSNKGSGGASDELVAFLGREKDQLIKHFDGKPIGSADLLDAKKKLEKDETYLREVESRMAEMLANLRDTSQQTGSRSQHCKNLLRDLVDLHRRLNDMMSDKYLKDDLNFESFFEGAEKPELEASGSLALVTG